jgi:hypothetical protein
VFSEYVIRKATEIGKLEELKELSEYIDHHNFKHIKKITATSHLINPKDLKDLIGINALRFIQQLLFRSKQLIEGTIFAINSNNIFLGTAAIRAHFETTGAAAYLLKQLRAYYEGKIDFAKLDEEFFRLAFGTKAPEIPQAPDPINVMSMIDAVDYLFSKDYPSSIGKKASHFREAYEFLCEFCHPNFHSHFVCTKCDNDEKATIFLDSCEVSGKDFALFFYLHLSVPLFIMFYDAILELINRNEIMPIITSK